VSTAVLEQEKLSLSTTYPALTKYVKEKAILHGRFDLASGATVSYYCDGKQVSFAGQGIALVVDAILDCLKDVDFDALGGMDMGATPIVSAVALKYFQIGRDLPTFVVRKEAKSHGTMKEIEGPLPKNPSRVVIVDDVVTSGGSILKAIRVVQSRGHEVVLAISLLDREEGGKECLRNAGIQYVPLVTRSQVGVVNGDDQASIASSTE
jgi:orotate phosphoribosyltransferase